MRLTNPDFMTARVRTWASGDQIASADLNTFQDKVIDANTDVDLLVTEIGAQALECQTGTGNQADSPAPDVGGAKTIWLDKITNGTAEVVLDTSVDWRDRYVIIVGAFTTAAASVAGGASDNAITHDLIDEASAVSTNMGALFFSRNGQDGTSANECYENTISGGNVIRFYARDTDGALCFKRTTAGTDNYFIGKIEGSPVQNHY